MDRHDFVDNGLNDYCLTCDLPRYSAVHEASTQEVKLAFRPALQGTWISIDDAREAEQKAKRLDDLIASGRTVLYINGQWHEAS